MRVLVFGTSNSLLQQGWVEGLRQGGLNVENCSVGMSPSTRFSAHSQHDFSKFDFVLFDSVPNDEVLERDIGDESFNFEILDAIFSHIANQTRLIVVGFCWKDNFEKKSSAFMRHKELAEKNGGKFIDISRLVGLFGNRFAMDINDLYEEHPAHPQSRISLEIGYSIATTIMKIDPHDWPMPVLQKTKNRFKNISADSENFSKHELIERKNSSVSARFASLKKGDFVKFDSGHCVGMYINLGTTNAIVNFECTDNIYSVQIFLAKGAWAKFTKLFIPIPYIKCSGIYITDKQSEISSINRYSGGTLNENEVALEISDLCFFDENQQNLNEKNLLIIT